MRILIVSHYFAPYQVMGAMRMSKLAKYWHGKGYEVRVISASNQPLRKSLPLEIPADKVVYTYWPYLKPYLERLVLRKPPSDAPPKPTAPRKGPSLKSRLAFYYKTITNFPDGYISWYPWALQAGRKLLANWKPDFILASAPPNTCLLVASKLSREFKVPWFADMRDLWLEDPYRVYPFKYPSWRNALENRLEQQVLGQAKGLITVSEPLAKVLRHKYRQPVQVITNGFDPQDYPTQQGLAQGGPLQILYTGTLYEGGRDPTPLMEAMQMLRLSPQQIELVFMGPPQLHQSPERFEYLMKSYEQMVQTVAQGFGVQHLVKARPPVTFKESVRLQTQADVLLLLIRNHPSEEGVFTGKVFEYVGASRPILAIGPSNNVAIQLVQERGLGLASQEPSQIAQWLQGLLQQKANGGIPNLPPSAKVGLSRNEQFEQMERFMLGVLGER